MIAKMKRRVWALNVDYGKPTKIKALFYNFCFNSLYQELACILMVLSISHVSELFKY